MSILVIARSVSPDSDHKHDTAEVYSAVSVAEAERFCELFNNSELSLVNRDMGGYPGVAYWLDTDEGLPTTAGWIAQYEEWATEMGEDGARVFSALCANEGRMNAMLDRKQANELLKEIEEANS